MKKKLMIPVNVVIILGIIAFVVIYARQEQSAAVSAKIDAFENLTVAMERVAENNLEREQRICDTWASFITTGNMSLKEAAERLKLVKTQAGVTIHLIYADDGTMSGFATETRPEAPADDAVSYAGLDLFRKPEEMGEIGEAVNITRTYRNPMNGALSIAFYDRIVLMEAGVRREALILRVVPVSVLSERWLFPAGEYKAAEISLIDKDGNYIMKGESFPDGGFFELYRSGNPAEYDRHPEPAEEFASESGTLTIRGTEGGDSLIVHCPISSSEGWSIIAYIPMAEFGNAGINWTLIVVVTLALLLLLAFDLISLLALNRAMEHAASAAEEASRAKSEFLSNMSHEIRTPITGILGMNEMIQRESDNKDVLDYSDSIKTAGVSLLGIINDILDFSKIEAGKMEIVPADYDLTSLVGDTVNLMLLRAEAKGLDFQVDVDPKLPKALYGDEIRVKQVLTNLLSNAMKYTEKGGVRMELRLRERHSDYILLYVSVDDTGVGIRKEEIDRLFAAFERLDEVRNRRIVGTGLGLPITQKILSLMGSGLEVQSEYGIGSKFFFTLRQKVTDWDPVGSFDPLSTIHAKHRRAHAYALYRAGRAYPDRGRHGNEPAGDFRPAEADKNTDRHGWRRRGVPRQICPGGVRFGFHGLPDAGYGRRRNPERPERALRRESGAHPRGLPYRERGIRDARVHDERGLYRLSHKACRYQRGGGCPFDVSSRGEGHSEG